MKLEAFKAGDYKQQYQYRSFSPALINHGWSWDDGRVGTLLEQATKALGELNAFSLIVKGTGVLYFTFCCKSKLWIAIFYFYEFPSDLAAVKALPY